MRLRFGGEESNVTKLMRWHDTEKYILLPFMLWHKNSTTKEQRGKARAFYNRLNRLGDQIFEIVFAECSAEEKNSLKILRKSLMCAIDILTKW